MRFCNLNESGIKRITKLNANVSYFCRCTASFQQKHKPDLLIQVFSTFRQIIFFKEDFRTRLLRLGYNTKIHLAVIFTHILTLQQDFLEDICKTFPSTTLNKAYYFNYCCLSVITSPTIIDTEYLLRG